MKRLLYLFLLVSVVTACQHRQEDASVPDMRDEAGEHASRALFFVNRGMLDEGTAEVRKAIEINKALNDTAALVSNYLLYARCSDSINNEVRYLLSLAAGNPEETQRIQVELRKAFYVRKFYHITPSVLMEHKPVSQSRRMSVETFIVEAYGAFHLHQYDSARMYADKIIATGTKYDQLCAYGFKEDCSINMLWRKDGNLPVFQDIYNYRRALYRRVTESMREQIETFRTNYGNERKIAAQQAALEKAGMQRTILLLIVGILLFVFVMVAYIIYNRNKQQREETARRLQSLELQRRYTEQCYESLQEESQRQIAVLQERLQTLDAEREHAVSNLTRERMQLTGEPFYAALLRDHKATAATWQQIEAFYERESPGFLSRLAHVALMDDNERSVSMLIRMGFSQSAIADIVHKTPQAINYTRRKLAAKALNADAATVKADLWNQIVESLL